jgi:hypothetical protein
MGNGELAGAGGLVLLTFHSLPFIYPKGLCNRIQQR